MAPQLTAMKGLLERRLWVWMNRAMSSFPGAAFASDQDGRVGGCNPLADVEDLLHHWMRSLHQEIVHGPPNFPREKRVKKVTALTAERKR